MQPNDSFGPEPPPKPGPMNVSFPINKVQISKPAVGPGPDFHVEFLHSNTYSCYNVYIIEVTFLWVLGLSIYHSEEFNRIAAVQKERQRAQDLEDYNNELRGADVGRVQRFLSAEAFEENKAAATGAKSSSSRLSTLEFLLLTDPQYARIHQAALDDNRAAQAKVSALQDRIEQVMTKLDNKIDETIDQAITLPDGRKAFMSKNGTAYAFDGEKIDPSIAEGFDWEGRPSYERYFLLTQDRNSLEDLQSDNEQHSLRLGEILEALEDEDDPETKDELGSLRAEQDGIVERLDRAESQVNSIDKRLNTPSKSNEMAPNELIAIAKPEI